MLLKKKKKIRFNFWQYHWQYLPYVTVDVALVIGIVNSLWKGWAKFWKLPRSPLNTQIKTLLEFSDTSTNISVMEENRSYIAIPSLHFSTVKIQHFF